MRRIAGLILTGLGAFLAVLAVLLRCYLPSQMIKFPLNEYKIAVLHGDNASYFSATKLRVLTGVSMTAMNTLRGDVIAGGSDTAVWDEFTVVKDDTNDTNLSYTLMRGPFDRRTGVLSNCCGAAVNGKPLHLSGQGYVWPFGTQQKTYLLFDTTLAKPVPARYAGTATVDGLRTYRYVEQVSPQQAGTQTLPGSLVGRKDQQSVTLPEYYQGTNTYWVDPVTGGPVNVQQKQRLTLRDSSGATRLVIFQADLKFTPKSIRNFADADRSGKNKITLITSVLPLILLLAGAVLLVLGIVLRLLGERAAEEPSSQAGFQPQDHGLAPR